MDQPETPAESPELAKGLQFEINPVDAATVRPLRLELLRPGCTLEDVVFPGDDDPLTHHVGTYTFDILCGIASVYSEPPPWQLDLKTSWRLRGMATSAGVRRRGVGKWMLAACMQHAWENGGTFMWCNARTSALDFYRVLGFEPHGERFDMPDIGEHIAMYRWLV